MITALIALFSTSGIGAIIGALGGLANRWLDLRSKQMDLEDKKAERAHQLSILEKEIAGQAQVASIEGEAKVEASAYAAMGDSYKADKATYGIKIVDGIRGLVRPFITAVFLAIIIYIKYRVFKVMDSGDVKLSADQVFEIIRWTLFEASVVIGWWFAMRPSGNSGLRIGK